MPIYDPELLSQAVSAMRNPGVDSSGVSRFAMAAKTKQDQQNAATAEAQTSNQWGMINAVANLYTSGAFGAVTGGVGQKQGGGGGVGIGNLGGGGAGGGGADSGLLSAANGILGRGGQGGGSGGGGGWQPDNSITQQYLRGRGL